MWKVNERTTVIITVSFFDEDDAPVIPSLVTYRLDDVKTGNAILARTDIIAPALAAVITIEVTPAQNQIISDANPFEIKRLTVEFWYGSGRHGTDEYLYVVKNLVCVSTPVSSSSPSASRSPSASVSLSQSPSASLSPSASASA